MTISKESRASALEVQPAEIGLRREQLEITVPVRTVGRRISAPSVQAAPEAEPRPSKPDPVFLLSEQLVSAALAAAPELQAAASQPGSVVVLRSPPGWANSACTAWLSILHAYPPSSAPLPDEVDEFPFADEQRPASTLPAVLVGTANEQGSPGRRRLTDDRILEALLEGVGLLVALDGDFAEPNLVAGSADLWVTLQPPDPAMLAAVAEAIAPGKAHSLAESVAAAAQPNDLVCALRPGQSSADFLRRVERIVTVRASAVPAEIPAPKQQWTLDTLPLAPAVEKWARQVAADLQGYAAGSLGWQDVEHGALLAGPPGCGKTTLAAALAATCGVPLIVTSYALMESGPDGKGRYSDILPNMRRTFAKAKKAAPCIMLFDEIDSVIARGQADHNESWFSAINNALLTETAAEARPGVVFLAATNFPDRVDAALRRSGRLDRVVTLDLPGIEQLARIVAFYLPGLSQADCSRAAADAAGSSGADIDRLARGARRRARGEHRDVALNDFAAELDDAVPPRSPERQRRIAAHEAGHAVVSHVRRPGSVSRASLRGAPGQPFSLGSVSMASRPQEMDTAAAIDGQVIEFLAGRAAEEIVLGEAGGGAVEDLRIATAICVLAEASLGLGARLTGVGDLDQQEVARILMTRPDIAAATESRLRRCYQAALDLLRTRRDALDAMADALLEHGALDSAEIASIVDRRRALKP